MNKSAQMSMSQAQFVLKRLANTINNNTLLHNQVKAYQNQAMGKLFIFLLY